MNIYIYENSYYIGNDEKVISNALGSEEITLEEGKTINVTNGVLSIIEEQI